MTMKPKIQRLTTGCRKGTQKKRGVNRNLNKSKPDPSIRQNQTSSEKPTLGGDPEREKKEGGKKGVLG